MSAHLRNSPDDDRHSCYRKRLSSGCSPDYESFTGQPRPASHRCRLAEIVHDGHEGLVGIAGTVVKEAHHRRPGFALDLFEGGVAEKKALLQEGRLRRVAGAQSVAHRRGVNLQGLTDNTPGGSDPLLLRSAPVHHRGR